MGRLGGGRTTFDVERAEHDAAARGKAQDCGGYCGDALGKAKDAMR
ncbi:hypothetical protein [Streptomyces yangpuensis]